VWPVSAEARAGDFAFAEHNLEAKNRQGTKSRGGSRTYLDLSAADLDHLASKLTACSQSNLTEGSL